MSERKAASPARRRRTPAPLNGAAAAMRSQASYVHAAPPTAFAVDIACTAGRDDRRLRMVRVVSSRCKAPDTACRDRSP